MRILKIHMAQKLVTFGMKIGTFYTKIRTFYAKIRTFYIKIGTFYIEIPTLGLRKLLKKRLLTKGWVFTGKCSGAGHQMG